MEMYNGMYEHIFFIIVESDSHDSCLHFTKKFKNAIDPWFFQLKNIKETKSARSGDVLKRSIQINHTAYAGDIIIFKEMIRTLAWHYSLMFNVNVIIDERGILPKDARRDLGN